MRDARTIAMTDMRTAPRLNDEGLGLRDDRLRTGAVAALATPISIGGKLAGVLLVQMNDVSRAWTGDDVRLIEGVARELRIALETARLLESRERGSDRLLALHRASTELATHTDTNTVIESILHNAVTLLGGVKVVVGCDQPEQATTVGGLLVRWALEQQVEQPDVALVDTASWPSEARGLWTRRRHGGEITSAYRTALAIVSAGATTTITASVLPVYVIVRRNMLGGTIGDNLPPAASEELLLNLVTCGGIVSVVVALNRLVEHSKSD